MGTGKRGLVVPIRPLFLDRDLGAKRLPALLREAGFDIRIHQDHFAHDTPDAEWIEAVAHEGWIAISGDKRIRSTPIALDCIRSVHAKVWIVSVKPPVEDRAAAIIRARDSIFRLSAVDGFLVATIRKGGDVHVNRRPGKDP